MHRRLFSVGLLALCLLLYACVVVPVPLGESHGPISSEIVAELVPGKSTRADVLTKVGEPDYEFLRQRWWVLKETRRSAGIGLIVVAGGPGGAGAGYEDLRKSVDVYLLIEFDAADHVARTLEVSASEPCTGDRDVCFRNGSLLAIYTPDWDKASKSDECTLYLIPLYASGEPERSWMVSDEFGAYVGYIGRGSYTGDAMRSVLPSGIHTLAVISDGVGPKLALRTTFACEAGKVVYLTVTDTTTVRAKLNLVEASDGRAALSGRLMSFVSEISE